MSAPDPIIVAIDAARTASARHSETCDALHHDDSEAAERACNAAADQDTASTEAVSRIRPTTLAGLTALVAFYVERVDQRDEAADYLRHILAALEDCDPTRLKSASDRQISFCCQGDVSPIRLGPGQQVPGPSEIEAAWHSLPTETRDRIGIIAVDMVFQSFVHGDACVACGQPEDRAFPDDTPEHNAIRGAAAEASDRRLNELTPLVEGLFPHLFGADSENPSWCPNPGPRP